MFIRFSSQVHPVPTHHVMTSAGNTVVFHGLLAARTPFRDPAHCSAPPLQACFRLPRLSRDVEAVTRPRSPLHVKREERSECGAVLDFGIDQFDVVEFKVEAEEAEEAPVEEVEEREVRAQLSALCVAPPAPAAASCPKKRGRPKGSKSRPRVNPQHDRSAPPVRGEFKKASAKIAAMK